MGEEGKMARAMAKAGDAEKLQPQPVREIFQYCLCLMMIQAGKMDTVLGEASPTYFLNHPLATPSVSSVRQ